MNDPLPDLRAATAAPFDMLLTRSDDHAAVRAVEAELRRHEVIFSRIEGAGRVRRTVELRVRAAQYALASHLAAMIFARRRRLERAFPRPKPPPEMPGSSPGGGIDGLPGF
jgi:hypothetical protein